MILELAGVAMVCEILQIGFIIRALQKEKENGANYYSSVATDEDHLRSTL